MQAQGAVAAAAAPEPFSLLGAQQEIINSRAGETNVCEDNLIVSRVAQLHLARAAEPCTTRTPVAAMLGVMIAAATELGTSQSVWSQIAGKNVDQELVQQPIGAAVLAFAGVVVAITFASLCPAVYNSEGPASRSFGPFTPRAALLNGRMAMLGFVGVLLVELVRGNVPLF